MELNDNQKKVYKELKRLNMRYPMSTVSKLRIGLDYGSVKEKVTKAWNELTVKEETEILVKFGKHILKSFQDEED